jgi:arylsulfatase A-like enzyme
MPALSARNLALALAALLALGGVAFAVARDDGGSSQGREHVPQTQNQNRAPYEGRGQPNFVMVVMDEMALSQVRPRVMPNVLELLRDQGTSFENAFLTTPLCCPSRATMITGQYGHNNGVLKNTYPSLRDKRNVLPVWLHRAGYVTAHVGKFLNRYRHNNKPTTVAPGWDQWHTQLDRSSDAYENWSMSRNGEKIHYGDRPSDYAPAVFERAALRLIRRFVPRRRPLYLQLDQVAPHPGRGGVGTPCNGGPVPAARDAARFRNVPLPEPPSFNERNMSDKPSFLQIQPKVTPDEIAKRIRKYRCALASLLSADRTVRRLVEELKRLGELDETVFIFLTDNGQFWGEHRVAGGKLYPYEEADRTPLFIRLPARYRKGQRRVAEVSEPVANIDLAPTILNLARARSCAAPGRCRVMDGRSLLPLLRGRSPQWAPERPLGVELRLRDANAEHAVCNYAAVRLPGVIYVRHTKVADPATGACVKKLERERYDLVDDPYQLQNLCFGVGSCPDDPLQRRLKRLVARIHHCSGIRGRDPRPPRGRYYCG